MHDVVRVLVGPAPWLAREVDGETGVAVVRAVERHHLAAAGVQPRHADRVLVGVGAAVGEEDLVHAVGREVDDALRGLAARRVGVLRRDRSQRGRLVLDRLDDLRVLVADVDVHELAREVEVLLAIEIPEVTTFSPCNRKWCDLCLR